MENNTSSSSLISTPQILPREVVPETQELQSFPAPRVPLDLNTAYILCGPTMCGKTSFTQNLLSVYSDLGLAAISISSDWLRKRFLLKSPARQFFQVDDDNRHSSQFQMASRQAFALLETELIQHSSFPLRADTIVVDTTGMDEGFRNFVRGTLEKNQFKTVLVTFEYKYLRDYQYGVTDPAQKKIVEASVERFRRRVLPTIKGSAYDFRVRVLGKGSFPFSYLPTTPSWNQEVLDNNPWKKNLELGLALREKSRQIQSAAIIGDSHECLPELKALISQIETKYPGKQIIHIGDYLDKGRDTIETVHYVYDRLAQGDIFIQGNHESYVVRRLRGEITPNLEMEAANFPSIVPLLQDEDARAKLFDVWDASLPFLVIDEGAELGNPVYVSHAPCKDTHLGMTNPLSLMCQRNYRTQDRTRPWRQEIDWLYKDADSSLPLHIFGHVNHFSQDPNKVTSYDVRYRNKVFLDTGCVSGGALTAVVVEKGRICDVLFEISTRRKEGFQYPPSNIELALGKGPDRTQEKFDIEKMDFSMTELRLFSHLINNPSKKPTRYISGTMSPSRSTADQLETYQSALDQFEKLGITEVIIEPKHMGSRAQLYLFKEGPEHTFMTSRAGWTIRGVEGKTPEEYKEYLASLWVKYQPLLDKYGDMILDGELLPWHALGKGLIENTFLPYQHLVKNELDTLSSDPALEAFPEFTSKMDFSEKKELLQKFEVVLSRFGAPAPAEFTPFDILHPRLKDRTTKQVWDEVSSHPAVVVQIGNLDSEKEGEQFFKDLVSAGAEGVVVKPNNREQYKFLPYLKVRGEEYLRLVYGYDYTHPSRYGRLVRQKKTTGKVLLSIKESNLADQLLDVPPGTDKHKYLVAELIGNLREEKGLDPRL